LEVTDGYKHTSLSQHGINDDSEKSFKMQKVQILLFHFEILNFISGFISKNHLF